MQQNDMDIARRSNLIAGMPQDVVAAILAQSVTPGYDRGETILVEGEPARTLYVVLEDWVKLYRVARNGGEADMARLREFAGQDPALAWDRAQ